MIDFFLGECREIYHSHGSYGLGIHNRVVFFGNFPDPTNFAFSKKSTTAINSLLWLVVTHYPYWEDGIPGLGSEVIGSSPLKKPQKKAIWKGNVALLRGITNHGNHGYYPLTSWDDPIKNKPTKKGHLEAVPQPRSGFTGTKTKKSQRPAIASLRSAYRHGQFLTTWCAVGSPWVMGWVVKTKPPVGHPKWWWKVRESPPNPQTKIWLSINTCSNCPESLNLPIFWVGN